MHDAQGDTPILAAHTAVQFDLGINHLASSRVVGGTHLPPVDIQLAIGPRQIDQATLPP
ncbi:hypothetical protein D3C86_2041300 [compost metagenome]